MNSKSLVSGSGDSGAYTDLNRLSSLKHGDRDSDANVRKVAQEFESLFISEMLKASRKASDVLADDNPMNTETVKQYRDMYDQQLAVSMSREGAVSACRTCWCASCRKRRVHRSIPARSRTLKAAPRRYGATRWLSPCKQPWRALIATM